MCFSATASFIAGGTLTVAGVLTLTQAKTKAELPFASVPLLFGIQQLAEGLVWLSFRFGAPWLNTSMTFIYSLFAFVFWPVYVPFTVRSLETVPWRRKLLSLFQLVGIAVSAYLLYFHIQLPVSSQVINKSIVYASPHFYTFWVITLYFTATCVSAFFSSHKLVNILGVLIFISAIVSYRFYTASFASVWCFFAAILSLFILGIFIYWRFKKNLLPKGGSKQISSQCKII